MIALYAASLMSHVWVLATGTLPPPVDSPMNNNELYKDLVHTLLEPEVGVCGSQALINGPQFFKSTHMHSACGVTWKFVDHSFQV